MMRRLLRIILSPWFTLIPLAVAVLLVILSLCLTGTMHVYSTHHFTLIQFGDTVTAGIGSHVLIRPFRLWGLAVILALPAMAWAVWFAIHLDSKKPKP